MKIRGFATSREVFMGPERLNPKASLKLYNHSPDGFNWGYGGSGPAQLALAILLHLFGKVRALHFYQNFKFDVIAKLDGEQDFTLSVSDVSAWMREMEQKEKKI